MSLVVDASVAVKWFVNESGHEDALAILDLRAELVAPDLFKAEFTNVLWKKVQRSEIGVDHAMLAIERVESFLTFLPLSVEAAQSALRLAVNLNHPSYDCVYLACAEELGGKLVTADRRFADKMTNAGYSHLVMNLEETKLIDFAQIVISDDDLKKLLRLSERFHETRASVLERLQAAGGGSILGAAEWRLAWDTPVQRTLKAALEKLSEEEIADLVALGWLGRGIDGTNFLALREHARTTFSDGFQNHTDYVVPLLRYVENGLALLNADQAPE